MLIDVYSVMRDEQILLPYWLRHYERFAYRIFVWEDNSTDATRAILEAHPKVTLLPMEKHGDDDVYWIKELFPQYKQHSRNVVDWVIIADADEFVYHPKLVHTLSHEHFIGTRLIQCRGYTMIADHVPTTSGQIYDEIKLGLPDALESKWTIFNPAIDIQFHKGRHGRPITRRGGANKKLDIKLLHYRWLGREFFEARDQKNINSLCELYNLEAECYPVDKWKRTLPDKSRGVAWKWFESHKAEAINVIDERIEL